MPTKTAIFRTNIVITALVVLGVVVLINFMASRHNARFDSTSSGSFSLSDQTLKLLKNLKSDLNIIVFDKPGAHIRTEAQDILTEYAYHSDKIKYVFVDPDQNPAKAKKHSVHRYGTILFQYEGKEERIRSVKEKSITNAIVKVTRKGKKTVYFLEGHGEHNFENDAKDGYSLIGAALREQNYAVKKVLLMREASVPSDASLLVVAGPTKEFFPNELDAVKKYIQGGGKVFFLLDPPPAVGMNDFLSEFGVKVGENMIVDKLSRLFGGDYFMPVITKYTVHPITDNFTVASFLPVARSIVPDSKTPDNMSVVSLAQTNEGSWAEVDLESEKVQYDHGEDIKGPVSIAAVVEARYYLDGKAAVKEEKAGHGGHGDSGETSEEGDKKEEKTGQLVIFGDSDFANNTYVNLSGNRDLFLNIISFLADEQDLISIRPKPKRLHTISMTEDQMGLVFYLSVVIIPLLAMTTGIVVWAKRRKL